MGLIAAAGYGVFGAAAMVAFSVGSPALAAFADPLLIGSLTCGAVTLIVLLVCLTMDRRTAGYLGLAFLAASALCAVAIGGHAVRRVTESIHQDVRFYEVSSAFHRYAEQHDGRFPPAANRGPDGRPLLSWRVLILPYLREKHLFREFRLDEPWDSPHNLALLPRMPRQYQSWVPSGVKDPPFTTRCQAVVGPGTAFDGPIGLDPRADFPDGLDWTLLVTESRTPVPWTKPEDIVYDPAGPLPDFGPEVPRTLCGRLFGYGRPEADVVGRGASGGSHDAIQFGPSWSEADLRKLIERANGVPERR